MHKLHQHMLPLAAAATAVVASIQHHHPASQCLPHLQQGCLKDTTCCTLNNVCGDLNLPLQPTSALVGGGVGCRPLSALPADGLLHGCALLMDNERQTVHFRKPAASYVA
jgi:hypothetical protein